jgi:hypothetical protein
MVMHDTYVTTLHMVVLKLAYHYHDDDDDDVDMTTRRGLAIATVVHNCAIGKIIAWVV